MCIFAIQYHQLSTLTLSNVTFMAFYTNTAFSIQANSAHIVTTAADLGCIVTPYPAKFYFYYG